MTENKIIIPIWKKSNLTVEEAAAYCGIGSRKLGEMSDSEFCLFVLWNGSKRLIKRRKLDEYLDNVMRKTGLMFDTTYSGKAFYGMMDYIKKNNISGNVIFWHTGGLMNLMK